MASLTMRIGNAALFVFGASSVHPRTAFALPLSKAFRAKRKLTTALVFGSFASFESFKSEGGASSVEKAKLHHFDALPVCARYPFIGHAPACGQGETIVIFFLSKVSRIKLIMRAADGTPGSMTRRAHFFCRIGEER